MINPGRCSRCGAKSDLISGQEVCPRCLLRTALNPEEDPFSGLIELGPYRLVDRIGAGGMGVVYRARDTRLGRFVAVKVITGRLLDDPVFMKRLTREAQAASSINHPHICTIHDIGDIEGVPYIVMEYLSGRTLDQVLKAGPFSPGLFRELSLQLADALEAARAQGIVHRDIKPSNLFLTEHNGVKILDFGIAREAPELGKGLESTWERDRLVGTLTYMSPEQVKGMPADHRSDLFALGAVMYEMATGRAPFSRATAGATVRAILDEDPVPIDRLNSVYHLEACVVTKLLKKEPSRRYQAAAEVTRDLQRIAASGPVRRLSRRRFRWTLKSGTSWVRATLALLLLVAVAVALAGFFRDWVPWWSASRIESVAVLPFSNLSGDPGQEYLADAMTDALISTLADSGAVHLPSLTSVRRVKDSSVRELVRRLRVDAVVEGSVQLSEGIVFVRVRLVDRNDRVLMQGDYGRSFGDILILQEEIAHSIAGEIEVELAHQRGRSPPGAVQVDPAAYAAVRRGIYLLRRRESFDKAAAYFQEAIDLEPLNAGTHAYLAIAHILSASYGQRPPQEAMPLARAAAEESVNLDDKLSRGLAALGWIRLVYDWDWEESDRLLRLAVHHNPRDVVARHWYALRLAAAGEMDRAQAQMAEARQIEPDSPVVSTGTAWIHYFRRDYEAAISSCDEALELEPGFSPAHLALSAIYLSRGDVAAALDTFEETLEGRMLQAQVEDLAALLEGLATPGENQLLRLEETAAGGGISPFYVAALMAHLDPDRCLDWLRRAVDARSEYVVNLGVDPMFDRYREQPEFQELIREVGIPVNEASPDEVVQSQLPAIDG